MTLWGGGNMSASRTHLRWLDGARGACALYVVLHHCWLMTYDGFPANHDPSTVEWLVYGHLAVAVFIVISGFSFTLRNTLRPQTTAKQASTSSCADFSELFHPALLQSFFLRLASLANLSHPQQGGR
jgi:peptidoglycan/LPS O-acetylase OafA/YrhL